MFFNLRNFNCIFQSCGIFCVILTVNKNQGVVLMILDHFSNTSEVLEQENIDELYIGIWRRKWQPTSGFLPGESQGQGSLVGCRLWGCTESDTTEATQRQHIGIYINLELYSSRILPLFQVSQSYYSQLTFYPKKTKLTKATTFEVSDTGQSIRLKTQLTSSISITTQRNYFVKLCYNILFFIQHQV